MFFAEPLDERQQHVNAPLIGSDEHAPALQIAQFADRPARRQSIGDLDDGSLAHAVHDEVRLAVEDDRPLHRVGPVVVMSESS